ncbi:MAG: high frequency lysogenization protein [Gammaproteobacteria bacterium]|jgi:high frequency lysogenization protein
MTTNLTALENQTIALAGVFQAASLVDQISTVGKINQSAFDCSFDSLFAFEASTTIEVYGDLASIQSGLKTLEMYLSGVGEKPTKAVTYYILTLLKIAKQLKKNDGMSSKIFEKLQAINTQSKTFEFGRSNVTSKVAELYQETISTVNPRIIVKGEQSYLSNTDTVSKIRTLLLAGIRSAILWNQIGGSQWRLLFTRASYVRSAKKLIEAI